MDQAETEIFSAEIQKQRSKLLARTERRIGTSAVQSPYLKEVVGSVTDVDFQRHHERGIRLALIDGDNTISRHNSPIVLPEIVFYFKDI